jgi:hypothetical protein
MRAAVPTGSSILVAVAFSPHSTFRTALLLRVYCYCTGSIREDKPTQRHKCVTSQMVLRCAHKSGEIRCADGNGMMKKLARAIQRKRGCSFKCDQYSRAAQRVPARLKRSTTSTKRNTHWHTNTVTRDIIRYTTTTCVGQRRPAARLKGTAKSLRESTSWNWK